jgi:hypothetical protein
VPCAVLDGLVEAVELLTPVASVVELGDVEAVV